MMGGVLVLCRSRLVEYPSWWRLCKGERERCGQRVCGVGRPAHNKVCGVRGAERGWPCQAVRRDTPKQRGASRPTAEKRRRTVRRCQLLRQSGDKSPHSKTAGRVEA